MHLRLQPQPGSARVLAQFLEQARGGLDAGIGQQDREPARPGASDQVAGTARALAQQGGDLVQFGQGVTFAGIGQFDRQQHVRRCGGDRTAQAAGADQSRQSPPRA